MGFTAFCLQIPSEQKPAVDVWHLRAPSSLGTLLPRMAPLMSFGYFLLLTWTLVIWPS